MSKRREPATKLDAFLSIHRLKPARIARQSGCSRQHLYRLRAGTMEPTRPVIRALRLAAQCVLKRRVRAEELFEL
jgi:DNA-binding phage protein